MLFEILVIKCVVQLELIQAIDHVIFFHNTSREDEQSILTYAQVSNVDIYTYGFRPPLPFNKGLFLQWDTIILVAGYFLVQL